MKGRDDKTLNQLITELPDDARAEVREFVEALIKKQKRQAGRFLRQSWAGALADYKDQFTSFDLQKTSFDTRHR